MATDTAWKNAAINLLMHLRDDYSHLLAHIATDAKQIGAGQWMAQQHFSSIVYHWAARLETWPAFLRTTIHHAECRPWQQPRNRWWSCPGSRRSSLPGVDIAALRLSNAALPPLLSWLVAMIAPAATTSQSEAIACESDSVIACRTFSFGSLDRDFEDHVAERRLRLVP